MKVLIFILLVNINAIVIADNLMSAIIAVESNGKANAIGDNGQAYGILQVHKSVVQDVNRIYSLRHTHQDMFNPERAKQVFTLYTKYYGDLYQKKAQQPATAEIIARIWNGGPNGYNNPATLKYWKKVKEAIRNEKTQTSLGSMGESNRQSS